MSSEMEIGDLKASSPTTSEARPQQFTAVNNNSNNNNSSNDSQRPSTDGPATNGSTNGSAQPQTSSPSQPPVAPPRNATSVFGGPSPGQSAIPAQSRPIIYSTGNGSSNTQTLSNITSTPSVRNNNGHLPHDRSSSGSPHITSTPLPAGDAWHSTEDALDSVNGQLKRKRSITPTTQTQHHHLAAHEAAMGAASMPAQNQTPQQRSGDDGMSGADEDGRSVRDVTLEDGSPHPQGIHIDPHTGIRVDPKRRKRVFSNRTKTGCITCRRRKKKCDEGKPECTNCKRGGFVCEGYSGKVSWQKPPGKQLPPSVATGPPYIVSKEEIPGAGSPTPGHLHSLPAGTPTSSHRISMDDRQYHPRSTGPADISVPPPSQDSTSPQGTQNFLPLRGETSQPASATTATAPHESVPASAGADRRVSFSHQALAAATGSMIRPRSEKEKMVNSELYHANTPELIAEREACKAACWRYNNVASNPNFGISEAEKGRLLLDIIRPGNKWEVVNTGAAPGTPGGLTYVSENGFTSDIIDVTVDAPFTCSYGYNIRLGKNVYIEFGCTILDSCSVTIKARTILSPGVSIYSATHPIDPRKRNGSRGPEMAKPVLIEEDCWLGGNVIVLGGITIGKGSVVGAGSVVTRDVPPFTVVAGNPARVIRGIYQNGVDM